MVDQSFTQWGTTSIDIRFERTRRWFRYMYLRLVRMDDDPRLVALGFSLGTFIGVFPSFGLGIPVAYWLAGRLRWNRAAALLGTAVMNPLTTPFFWGVSWGFGAVLFRIDAATIAQAKAGMEGVGWSTLGALLEGPRLKIVLFGGAVYLVGNTVISLAVSTASYAIVLRAIRLYRHERERVIAWRRAHEAAKRTGKEPPGQGG